MYITVTVIATITDTYVIKASTAEEAEQQARDRFTDRLSDWPGGLRIERAAAVDFSDEKAGA